MQSILLATCLLAVSACAEGASPTDSALPPRTHVYREADGRPLRAHVFLPPGREPRARANAILLFHGGGWSAGSPEWTFSAARRFSDLGLVAIAVEYRLSEGEVTPIEALDDACAALRWTREKRDEFLLTGRIAGYGVSAGGQLIAATATVGCAGGDAGPDALLLWSPALDLANDRWFAKLLQGRANAADYSPANHVSPSTPSTCIVHGAEDTLTPLAGARRYCERLTQAGGVCELVVFDGVGHLLTRNLRNQESEFDPDPDARAQGIERQAQFLRRLGFIADQ